MSLSSRSSQVTKQTCFPVWTSEAVISLPPTLVGRSRHLPLSLGHSTQWVLSKGRLPWSCDTSSFPSKEPVS